MASHDGDNNTVDDWQTTKETVRERSSFLFNNPVMSDIRFDVFDSSDDSKIVRVPAHKFVLGMCSPVFYAMFYGSLSETNAEIEMPDAESKSLLEFLRFVYSDEVNLTSGNVLGVMYLAKKYIVPPLLKKCASFLEEQICEENVLETFMEARKFHQHELEERCLNIVDVCTEQCLKSDSISKLDLQAMTDIMKRDTLSVNECSIFRAVTKWAEIKCEEKQLEATGARVRELLGDSLSHIRFPTMPQDKFAQEVVHRGILTESEVINIFLHYSSAPPKSHLRFSSLPRSSKKLQRCCLHADGPAPLTRLDIHHNTMITAEYTSITDSLEFVVDKPVLFKGVRLYAREHENVQFKAELRLRGSEQKELGDVKGKYCTRIGGLNNWVGFDVELLRPVCLKSKGRYSISVVITNAGQANVAKNKGHGQFSTSSVTYFRIVSKSRNTPILELLFYATC